jgi:SAM-dependent methyltransferase
VRKGWFAIPGVQKGDRTLAEQLKGLGPLLDEVDHKRVLDLGCAEGLILREVMMRGAAEGCGVEFNPEIYEEAVRQLAPYAASVYCLDLNDPLALPIEPDVVLLLAILHKLRNPEQLIAAVIAQAPQLIVVRFPRGASGIIRCKFDLRIACNVDAEMHKGGYGIERTLPGPREELVRYYRRGA